MKKEGMRRGLRLLLRQGLAGTISAILLLAVSAALASGGTRPVPVRRITRETRLGPYSLLPAEEASLPSALLAIDSLFALYPEGFFTRLVREEGLTLILSGGMEPLTPDYPENAGAFTVREGGRTLILLDASGGISRWTLMHELCHAADRLLARLGEEGELDWSEESWLSLCPEGFDYFYCYKDESGRPLDLFGSPEYTAEAEGEAWFINRYSKTFPTEDRAVLFETLMRAGESADYLKSPHIRAKLARYFAALRSALDEKNRWGRVFWEEKLEAVIMGEG